MPNKYLDYSKKIIRFILVQLGILFILFSLYVGPRMIFGMVSEPMIYLFAYDYHEDIRGITLNHTTYSGGDPFQWALDVAYALPTIRYVPASQFSILQDADHTYQYGGDCKNLVWMFDAIMLSLGIDGKRDCNLKHKHCVYRVDRGDEYMILDLTVPSYYIYNKSIDHWNKPFAYTFGGKL